MNGHDLLIYLFYTSAFFVCFYDGRKIIRGIFYSGFYRQTVGQTDNACPVFPFTTASSGVARRDPKEVAMVVGATAAGVAVMVVNPAYAQRIAPLGVADVVATSEHWSQRFGDDRA